MSHGGTAVTGGVPAGVRPPETVTYPPAQIDRRLYALVVDRLVAWSAYAVAAALGWHLLWREGRPWTAAALLLGVVVVVALAMAVAEGTTGRTPGKGLLDLRTVHHGTGTPVGVGRALLRTTVLGLSGLPTAGVGLAMLAWTATVDPGRQRRGWHDRVAHSIVVDVRPAPVQQAAAAEEAPRHVVNLTAMRLAPPPAVAPPAHRFPAPATERPRAEAPAPSAVPAPPTRAPSPAPGGVAVPSGWVAVFDTGQRVPVDGLVLVGRRPEPRPGEQVLQRVGLPSADMSLSKTHAQVQVAADGALVVMDRGSTNGSVLVRRGVTRDLPGGRPVTLVDGDTVRFGDREMTVRRER